MELTSPLNVALLLGLVTIFWTFFSKLHRARMLLISRRRQGLPVAPNHSYIFGHLLYLKSVLDRLPNNVHRQEIFATIARECFMETGAFYIDLWPMSGLYLIIVSPKIGVEITQTNPKLTSERPELLRRFMRPITGGSSLFDLDEKNWKPWRAVFNKGFTSERMYSLVPGMIEEVQVYADNLRNLAAKNEICYLEPITLRFTLDMIGRTVLNTSLNAQREYNALADGMLSQLSWHNANNAEVNPFSQLDFVREFVYWKNGRQVNRYIGEELDKRYEEFKAEPSNPNSKSVIDLVIQEYLKSSKTLPEKLDATFRAFAIRQVRLFVFAGYDSTGSVLCYCFHLLSKHPKVLARLRAEHDEILGPNPQAAFAQFAHSPRIVNDLPYTLAVIKEVMRLFPPAAATRAGKPGVGVTDDAGNILPTDEAIMWILHVEMQRSPKYWNQPDSFLPERWLVSSDHELYPRPGAWRPFELGPRNCIGQALVLIELRVILACLIRDFDVSPAYDELDAQNPRKGIKLYRGERAYQVEKGAAHPIQEYPCRIRLASRV